MDMPKIASIYSILVGISMIGLWIMLLTTNQVPELATEPYRISAHILAEILTAVLLLAGGSALLRKMTWGYPIYLFGQGALFYTLIASPGYYLQLGEAPMVIMFSFILLLNIAFLILALRRHEEFSTA